MARIISLVLGTLAVAASISVLALGASPRGTSAVGLEVTSTATATDTPIPCGVVLTSIVSSFDGVPTCTPIPVVHTATPTVTATAPAANTSTPVPATAAPTNTAVPTATSPTGGAGANIVAPSTGSGPTASGNNEQLLLLGAVLFALGAGSFVMAARGYGSR